MGDPAWLPYTEHNLIFDNSMTGGVPDHIVLSAWSSDDTVSFDAFGVNIMTWNVGGTERCFASLQADANQNMSVINISGNSVSQSIANATCGGGSSGP